MSQDLQSAQGETPQVEHVLKVFDSEESGGKVLELLVDEARLAAYVRITLMTPGVSVAPADVTSFLERHSVRTGELARENIKMALESLAAGDLLADPFPVADGRRPVDGSDGRIEWLVPRPQSGSPSADLRRVDYRELNAIVNVVQGQKIVRLTAPVPGQPGEDVFGAPIACQEGRAASIRRGKNVDVTGDGLEFFAQTTGKLEVDGDTVAVDPVFTISGDVDMSVGNVSFIGPVRIGGDVRDGFRVKAGKEIEVGGMVESADLESGAYIRIQGGIAGKGRARITCKQGLEARYLSEVVVESGGDVVIANSITNSQVKSLGKVAVSGGGIRGSSVVAQGGLQSPEIGSEMGVRTVVVVGVDYHLKDKLVNVEREMAVIREAVEKIEKALGPLMANGELIAALPAGRAEIARRLVTQLGMLVERADALAGKRGQLLAKMQIASGLFIEVSKKIYPGVVMQIGTCRRTFELEVAGPMKLFPDVENGSVKVSR